MLLVNITIITYIATIWWQITEQATKFGNLVLYQMTVRYTTDLGLTAKISLEVGSYVL